jgi:hypothetical protein
VNRYNDPNPPDLNPIGMMDNSNGFAEYNETDYTLREQLEANNNMAPNRSPSAEVKNEGTPGWYAEEYNPENVAHILRKSQSTFETLKEKQNNARLAEKP